LAEHFRIDVRSLRNEIAVFKVFVVLWFFGRSALFSKRYAPEIIDALQSAYVRCVIKRPKSQEDQDFFYAVSAQHVDTYNAAYLAWHSGIRAGSPELHMYDVADAFSTFCGVDPAIQQGLTMAVYEYLMKDLWFAIGEMLKSSEDLG
jgi:hypothetical protein